MVSAFLTCRALEEHKRQMEESEEERRQAVLKERRREQDRARASFRQAVHPRGKAASSAPQRKQAGSRGQCGKNMPTTATTLDAKEIADMVAGKRQVSVPSLDEMLAQLRGETPVAAQEPPVVGRAGETCSGPGSVVEEGSLPPPPNGDKPEVPLDTSTGPELPGSIYSRENYASLARDSLEVEGGVRQPSPHAPPSQWADKVCLLDSLDSSSSGLHLSEPVLGISREMERVVNTRPSTTSEADLLARLSSAGAPRQPPSGGTHQPTSILKKSGQKAILKQILSSATAASGPQASPNSKHVHFADDPSLVCETDCEVDDFSPSYRAMPSNGSSAHFLFSHGSEFAFRPLRNGLVPLPVGEKKPLHDQSGGVAHSDAVPASSSQSAMPSTSKTGSTPPPAAIPGPPLPQSSLSNKHRGDANRQGHQEEEALNQTPTDDQISKLWSQMRGYLAENKELQETQRAGLQRLKQFTQSSWQRKEGWVTTTQTEQPGTRPGIVRTRRAAATLVRGGGDAPTCAPLQGGSHPVQEWRGSSRGAGQPHPPGNDVEGVKCLPQAVYSQQEPADHAVSRRRRETSECVCGFIHSFAVLTGCLSSLLYRGVVLCESSWHPWTGCLLSQCPELSLRQQEQQLMESIERLNSQLQCECGTLVSNVAVY